MGTRSFLYNAHIYTSNIFISDLNVYVYPVQQVSNVKLILMNVIATHAIGVVVKIESVVILVYVMKVLKAYIVKWKLMNVKDSSMINILYVTNKLNFN